MISFDAPCPHCGRVCRWEQRARVDGVVEVGTFTIDCEDDKVEAA